MSSVSIPRIPPPAGLPPWFHPGFLRAAAALLVLAAGLSKAGQPVDDGAVPSGPGQVAEPVPDSGNAIGDAAIPSLESLLWSTSVTLRTGAGYHDNARLSSLNPEGSAFLSGGAEVVVMRVPADGHEGSVFVSIDHRGYLERGFAPETLAAGDLRYVRRWNDRWSLGTSVEYLFLKQVFDASELEGIPAVVLAQGHTLTVRPTLGLDIDRAWRIELEGELARQWLDDPLDGYADAGPRLALARQWGPRRTLGVSYRLRSRSFDDRGPRDDTGSELPETLQYQQHEAEVAWRHAWGAGQRWRVVLRPGWVRSLDNGNGFFDYERFQVAGTLRWVGVRWEARVDARLRAYRYPGQVASAAASEDRRRLDSNVSARLDWKPQPWLRVFVQYERDQTDENTVASDLRANVGSSGIEVEW